MFRLVDGRQEWEGELARFPQVDFFHRYDYLKLESARLGGRAVLAICKEEVGAVALPLVLRPIPQAAHLEDAVSPYGYVGLLASADTRQALDSLCERLVQGLSALGLVALFSRSHPFLAADLPDASPAGETLAISLRQNVRNYERGLNSGHIEEIRKLRAVVVVERGTSLAQVRRFYELYIRTMHRRKASPSYLFSEDYVNELVAISGPDSSVDLAWVNGRLAAGCFFIRTPSLVHYHLSASDPEAARYPATKLLIDETVRGELALGKRDWLHLGGGLGGKKDSLHAFKAGFGGTPRPFALAKRILDPVSYELLSASCSEKPSPGFFPAYRSSAL